MSSAFAIAAGVVGVAGAATSAGISMSASDRAAKASSRQGKKYQKQLQAATDQYSRQLDEYNRKQNEVRSLIQNIDPNLNIPQYNLEGATQEAIRSANAVTDNTIAQLKNLIGRNPKDIFSKGLAQAEQWSNRINRAGQIAATLAEGDLTERQRRQLAQVNAEMVGATYNPEAARRTAGFQVGQAQLLEATRQASEERQRFGLSSIGGLGEAARGWQGSTMAWMELGKSFQQPVTQMMGIGLQGRQQDIGVAEANIMNQFRQAGALGDINATELAAAQNLYNARTGQAQQVYNVGQQNIQNTLASRQAVGQGVQSISSATAGALSGVGSAYAGLGAAQMGSTTPNAAGFYQGQIGAANAYGASPSQLSYQNPSGGFLGIGGQGGGYYYTPGGVYGRA